MEDDRVILLDKFGEPVAEDEDENVDMNLTDPTGMFSLTEITNSDNKTIEDNDDTEEGLEQNNNDENDQEENTVDDPNATSNVIYVAAVIAALGGLLFGYDIGIISGAKIQIQKEIDLSCFQIELIVAMLPVGAFVASLGGGEGFFKYLPISFFLTTFLLVLYGFF